MSRFEIDVNIKSAEIVKALLEEIDSSVESELLSIECEINQIEEGEKNGDIDKLKNRYKVVKTAYQNIEHFVGSLV